MHTHKIDSKRKRFRKCVHARTQTRRIIRINTKALSNDETVRWLWRFDRVDRSVTLSPRAHLPPLERIHGADSSIKPIAGKQHSTERPETFGGWSRCLRACRRSSHAMIYLHNSWISTETSGGWNSPRWVPVISESAAALHPGAAVSGKNAERKVVFSIRSRRSRKNPRRRSSSTPVSIVRSRVFSMVASFFRYIIELGERIPFPSRCAHTVWI